MRSLIRMMVVLALFAPASALAQSWHTMPNDFGELLGGMGSDDLSPHCVPDADGGVIAVWSENYASGTAVRILAQRFAADGSKLWDVNGTTVCAFSGRRGRIAVSPDGLGGVVIAWADRRSGTAWQAYAQRVDDTGAARWGADGHEVSFHAIEDDPAIVGDGVGGAFIAWEDLVNGWSNPDIGLAHIDASNQNRWEIVACGNGRHQTVPAITSDGAGGCVVAWFDDRECLNGVFAQRVNAAGQRAWPADGVRMNVTWGSKMRLALVPDGSGGAIATWTDFRNIPAYAGIDVYAQRILGTGALRWTSDGVRVCGATGDQDFAQSVGDGAGGALFAWQDARGHDIYAQRLDANGDPQWAADGIAAGSADGVQMTPLLTADGAGGARLVWADTQDPATTRLRSQRLHSDGSLLDGVAGRVFCDVPGDRWLGNRQNGIGLYGRDGLLPAGSNAAFLGWTDLRDPSWARVYVGRIDDASPAAFIAPRITAVIDAPGDEGGAVDVRWAPTSADDGSARIAHYRVLRRAPDEAAWTEVATRPATVAADYAARVATPGDALPGTGAGSAASVTYVVEAVGGTAAPTLRIASAPVDGWSVDNTPPAMPTGGIALRTAQGAHVEWQANTEPDFANYRVYVSDALEFPFDAAHLLATQAGASLDDVARPGAVYKVVAVDTHDNASAPATIVLAGSVDAPGSGARALAFAAPSPNPARGTATLRWSLARSGPAEVALFDAGGRRVAVLAGGVQEAGEHVVSARLADGSGRALPAGLYLARLTAEGRTLTRTLAVVR